VFLRGAVLLVELGNRDQFSGRRIFWYGIR